MKSITRQKSLEEIAEQLADLDKLLGHPLSVEPWPGPSGRDRLWAFRVRPLPAERTSVVKPEEER